MNGTLFLQSTIFCYITRIDAGALGFPVKMER
jgi:hypothetical protein